MIEAHGGDVIKFAGDALLISFSFPRDHKAAKKPVPSDASQAKGGGQSEAKSAKPQTIAPVAAAAVAASGARGPGKGKGQQVPQAAAGNWRRFQGKRREVGSEQLRSEAKELGLAISKVDTSELERFRRMQQEQLSHVNSAFNTARNSERPHVACPAEEASPQHALILHAIRCGLDLHERFHDYIPYVFDCFFCIRLLC